MAEPGAADQARDAVLARLDARIRQHDDRIAELAGAVGETADLLAQVVPRLDRLDTTSTETAGAAGNTGPDSDAAPLCPVRWERLTADQAEREWRRLADWVAEVLGPWYDIRRSTLPDCWALHPPVVRRLSALHTAYDAAYTGPSAGPGAVVYWHDRWLPHTLDLITQEEPRPPTQAARTGTEHNCAPGRHHGAAADGTPLLTTDGRPVAAAPTRLATDHDTHTRRATPGQPIPLAADPIHPDHWTPFWHHAMTTDLERRRRQTDRR